MAEKTTAKAKKRDGRSASVDLTEVMPDFEKLKAHCKNNAPFVKLNNSDIVRFAIIHAAKHLEAQ